MTPNGEFPDAIRDAAGTLRRGSVDPVRAARIHATIMERVTRRPEGIAELLSAWLRIAVAPLAAAAIIAVTATVIVQKDSIDEYGTRTALVAMQSEALSVDE